MITRRFLIFLLFLTTLLISFACSNQSDEQNQSIQSDTANSTAAAQVTEAVPGQSAIIEKYDNGSKKIVRQYEQDTVNYTEWQYYPDGSLKMKGNIRNNERNGLWRFFYKQGSLWTTAEYQDGKEHGLKVTYYPNGNTRYHGEKHHGNRTGTWKFYHENGEKAKEVDYEEH
ncbi:MAG: toxin-antitoxin system YwqK family antitoxin [Bacteroidota bacterium]